MLESIMKECLKHFECVLDIDQGYDVREFDYLFILGDRWNLISIVTEAIKHNIPIIHQGGGEVSLGSYDDTFRKMYSQAASYHFVIDEKCKENLKVMGIIENVFVCGSPRMDYLKQKTKGYKDKIIVLYHPATKADENFNEIRNALNDFSLEKIYITCGDDIGAEKINDMIISKNENHDKWVEYLESALVLVGNTSAGISEAPSYELPVVNIGHRQDGREKLKNVIDCECKENDIIKAINKALSIEFRTSLKGLVNTFSDGHAGKRIADILNKELNK